MVTAGIHEGTEIVAEGVSAAGHAISIKTDQGDRGLTLFFYNKEAMAYMRDVLQEALDDLEEGGRE